MTENNESDFTTHDYALYSPDPDYTCEMVDVEIQQETFTTMEALIYAEGRLMGEHPSIAKLFKTCRTASERALADKIEASNDEPKGIVWGDE